MEWGYIADAVLIAVLALGFWLGMKRGLARGIYSLAAFAVAAGAAIFFCGDITARISAGQLAGNLHDAIYRAVSSMLPADGITAESLEFLPDFMARLATAGAGSGSADMIAGNVAAIVTTMILKAAVFIGLFIVVRFLIWVVFLIIDAVFKLPVLKQANSIAGGFLGLMNAALMLYIVLGAAAVVFIGQGDIFEDTLLLKWFYSENLLLRALFGG